MNPEHVLDPVLPEEATEFIAIAEQFVQAIRDYMLNAGYPRESSAPDNSQEYGRNEATRQDLLCYPVGRMQTGDDPALELRSFRSLL
jgi:hypothetical protein